MEIKIQYRFSQSVKKGNVVSQSMKVGKKYKKGTKIVLVVSKGKKYISTTPKSTTRPTPVPVEPQKNETDFAGELPW